MFCPSHFEETRVEVMRGLIEKYPLGTLVTVQPDGLAADHLPFRCDAHPTSANPLGVLRCHVAKSNPLWKLDLNQEVMVVFQGPNTYVSPNWYATKQDSGKVVPTWNYAVVHVYGRMVVHHDAEWIREMVEELTTTHESTQIKPWRLQDAPSDYIDRMIAAIVGIQIDISRMLGKWKISQNKSQEDQHGIACGLEIQANENANELAKMLRSHMTK